MKRTISQKGKQYLWISFSCLLLIGIGLFVWAKAYTDTTDRTVTMEESKNVVNMLIDPSHSNYTEEEKKRILNQYYKEDIEQLLDMVDWTGRENEREQYKEYFLSNLGIENNKEELK